MTAEPENLPLDAKSHPLPRRIVLTGFMGAGKSTAGRLLAAQLAWRFTDVDDIIEAAQGSTIAEIFASRGEAWFREAEHSTIASLLKNENLVLALGGGAIEHPGTRELVLNSPDTLLVHLEATLETVLLRCKGTEDARPVLRDRERLESRYVQRLPLYRFAHITVPVDNLSPDQVVKAVLSHLPTVVQA